MNIPFANVYLTRGCNLKCGHCNVWKSTKVYPPIDYYMKNERTLEWWKGFFSEWYEVYPETFFSIMGGEPLLVDWLPELVEYLNELGVLYTIISNCSRGLVKKFFDKVSYVRGFTASIDVKDDEPDIFRTVKSDIGLEALLKLKDKFGDKIDCCAECTLNRYNMRHLPKLLDFLDSKEIFISVSVIDPKLSEYYDFSDVPYDEDIFVQKDALTRSIFDYAKTIKHVHMPMLLDYLYEDLPYSVPELADLIRYISIDSDGSVRYSLRIKGVDVPRNVSYRHLLSMKNDKAMKLLVTNFYEMDRETYDRGINWSGIYMSKCLRMKKHSHEDKIHYMETKEGM